MRTAASRHGPRLCQAFFKSIPHPEIKMVVFPNTHI